MICRALSKDFTKVIGTDPSQGMIEQATSRTTSSEYPNVEFTEANAESLPFAKDQSVDMVVAGQAAHWFDYPGLFAALKRVMRPGGTLAFWGYKDPMFVDYPQANELLKHFYYDKQDPDALGPYWQQPGRSVVQNKYRAIKPSGDEWEDIQRVEYEPACNGPHSGEGTPFIEMKAPISAFMEYTRTFSAYHGWQEAHPDRRKKSAGGSGDNVDELFDKIVASERSLQEVENWQDKIADIEWGSGLLFARKK